ncbi:Subtilisin-like protease 1 [Linum grandiflorum]
MQNGIFVSCSAGNNGPDSSSLHNEAPWVLTVGASTIDRDIRTTVTLGNNAQYHGQSLFQPKDFHPQQLPFVDAGMNSNASATFCDEGSLKNIDVRGKIVLCQFGGDSGIVKKGVEVKKNGGVGMILINNLERGFFTTPAAHVLPASHISTLIGNLSAPQIALFSSRGPSTLTPGILKPDIIGPGVSILAAWGESIDNTTVSFNIVSGTSMSCPHLSGVAAVIKAVHPDWSPAAIKSAILTTAYTVDRSGKPILNEQNDIQPDDYIGYLCGLGYNDTQVSMIVQRKVKCLNESVIPEAQLNYPTFSISLGSSPQTYTRTVTNVTPSEIKFKELNEKATYTITFSRVGNVKRTVSQGSLVWSSADNQYNVVSTIAVVFV